MSCYVYVLFYSNIYIIHKDKNKMKEEKFNCGKCRKEIGRHNQYLHDGMRNDCFFETYFPEEEDE